MSSSLEAEVESVCAPYSFRREPIACLCPLNIDPAENKLRRPFISVEVHFGNDGRFKAGGTRSSLRPGLIFIFIFVCADYSGVGN